MWFCSFHTRTMISRAYEYFSFFIVNEFRRSGDPSPIVIILFHYISDSLIFIWPFIRPVVDRRIAVISWRKNHVFVRIFYKEQSLYFLIVDLNFSFAGKLFRARTYTVVVAPSFQFHVVDSPAIDNYILANLTPIPLHIHQDNSSLIFTSFHIYAVIQLQSRGRSSRKKDREDTHKCWTRGVAPHLSHVQFHGKYG